jgi:hypothetical protein
MRAIGFLTPHCAFGLPSSLAIVYLIIGKPDVGESLLVIGAAATVGADVNHLRSLVAAGGRPTQAVDGCPSPKPSRDAADACDPQLFRPNRFRFDSVTSEDVREPPGLWHPFAMRQRSSRLIVCGTVGRLLVDALRLVSLGVRLRSQLAAENLFLRKQLALYQEREVKPRRADDATRISLVVLSRLIDWRTVLTIVKPDTLIRCHRRGFPPVLAVEVEGARPSAIASRSAAADCRHGSCERDVGRGADCRGTAAQARPPRVAAHGEALHGPDWATSRSHIVPPMEHLRATSRWCDACLRFLRDHHGDVSQAVRLCRS